MYIYIYIHIYIYIPNGKKYNRIEKVRYILYHLRFEI